MIIAQEKNLANSQTMVFFFTINIHFIHLPIRACDPSDLVA